jgi:peptide/nickel transport system permease protein
MTQSAPALVQPRTVTVAVDARPLRQRPNLWRRLVRNRGARIGLVLGAALFLLAVVGPLLVRMDPLAASAALQLKPPGPGGLLGADQLGRDVAARLVFGAPLSLRVGFIVVAGAAALGIVVGLPAGFFGGRTDMLVMRLVDVLLAFPSILLAMGLISVLGPNLNNAMLAVGISIVPTYVRLVRASTLATRDLPYVDAARVIGCGSLRLMFRHVLPNVLPPVIVAATLGVATAILATSSLSFLGLGAQPPTPEWGAMLAEGRGFLRDAWWLPTFPGIAIMLAVLSVNLIGDGLRDALDPRMSR